MALACPPQLFYNTPASDPLAQSLDFFVHVIEPIKDALGVAWCTGSGYVVRREALEEIGNFPLGSLAEDVATSTLMLGKGWKTAYMHEPLQFGTVPEDYGGHLKQRTRWAIGTVDTAFKLKFCLWGDAVRKMTVAQRFSGFLYATLSVYTLLLTASLFAIPIILLWGKQPSRLCEPRSNSTGSSGPVSPQPSPTVCAKWRFSSQLATTLVSEARATNCGCRPTLLSASCDPSSCPNGSVVKHKPSSQPVLSAPLLTSAMPKSPRTCLSDSASSSFNYMAIFHLAFVYVTLVAVVISSYRCFAQNTASRDIILCLDHARLLASSHLPFHLHFPLDPGLLRYRSTHHAGARGSPHSRPQDRRSPSNQEEQEDRLRWPSRVVRTRVQRRHRGDHLGLCLLLHLLILATWL